MPRYSYLTNCTKYYQSIKLRPRLHLLFSLVMVWSFIIPGPLGPHLITMVSLTTTVLVLRTFWHLPTFTPFSYLYHFFIFFFLRVAYVVLCSSCLSHTSFPVSIDIIVSLVFHSAIQETQAFWQAFFFPFFLIVFPRLAWHVPQQFVYNFILRAVIYFKGILNYLNNQYIFSHF